LSKSEIYFLAAKLNNQIKIKPKTKKEMVILVIVEAANLPSRNEAFSLESSMIRHYSNGQ